MTGNISKEDLVREYRHAEKCGDYDYAREIAWAFDCIFDESIFRYLREGVTA